MSRAPFSRFRIQGTLTTNSPLHVGDGFEIEMQINGHPVQVATVITDNRHKPFIPGSALKGILRQRGEQHSTRIDLIHSLFGTDNPNNETAGRLTIHNALMLTTKSSTPPLFGTVFQGGRVPLNWNPDRMTYVMAGSALNRITRTARENKLYHYEVVPPNMVFQVVIDGEALEEHEQAMLMECLDQFNVLDGIAAGGFISHGFGRMKWNLEQVSGLRNEGELNQWVNRAAQDSLVGYRSLPVISTQEIARIRNNARLDLSPGANALILDMEICFDGPFMINDPSGAYKTPGENDRNDDGQIPNANPGGQDSLSHAYLKGCDGQAVLTGKSLHGALRMQAEKIVRTIVQGDPVEKACYIDSRDRACRPVASLAEAEKLCYTCRLFGGSGWRSPITIYDFLPENGCEGEEFIQEFVGIDRFTGGAAEEMKFNAAYLYRPCMKGKLKIELNRIEPKHLGLLILTFRDLMEGDIPLGFGASKGFGACHARIAGIAFPDFDIPWLQEILTETGCENDTMLETSFPLNESQQLILQDLVEKFIEEVNNHAVS